MAQNGLGHKGLFGCLAALSLWSNQAFAVLWMEQTERLQNVSASLLDGFPVLEPSVKRLGLGVKFHLSFLPAVNPRVGSKQEKVPSSPIHTVPTFYGEYTLSLSKKMGLGLMGWLGYLPAGTEKLMGIKASLNQSQFGAAVALHSKFSGLMLSLPLGLQSGSANLKGSITEAHANDSFQATSLLLFAAPSVKQIKTGLFGQFLMAMKKTQSTFYIESDDTTFVRQDTLQDSSLPLAFQFTLGWESKLGATVSLSELLVPNRLMMPRLSFSYTYDVMKRTPNSSKSTKPKTLKKPKTPKKTKKPKSSLLDDGSTISEGITY